MGVIQIRRDTAEAWTASNKVLAEGEFGYEKITGLFKIGDGIRGWNSLPYAAANTGLFDSALMSSIEDPAPAPAGKLRLYAKTIAGRNFPKFVGSSGLSTSLQPLLARNKVGYWCPSGNVVTQPGILGYTTMTALTAVVRNVAVTNMFTRMRRLGFVSPATANGSTTARVAVAQVTLSNGLGEGGFFKVCRWGISDVTLVPTAKTFVGVSSTTTALPNTEPSTYLNSIGMGHNTGDSNFSIYYGGSIAQTPIDLGPDFPCNTSNTDVYELALFSPPNDTGIRWEVTRLNTGHVASGYIAHTSLGVTLPSDLTLLTYHTASRFNGATAAVVGIDIMSDYIETDV